MESEAAKRVKDLMRQKESIEDELKELMTVLESQKGVGLSEPLTDKEDYPRNDIDVYSVRHARHRVICLQGDHKRLMVEIEQTLHAVHEKARNTAAAGAPSGDSAMEIEGGGSGGDCDPNLEKNVFLTVDRVDAGSPASEAGLCVGDAVLEFGSIKRDNFRGLTDVGKLVQHSKGRAVTVTVLRGGVSVRLSLTPKSWAGNGLLGCNIVPVK